MSFIGDALKQAIEQAMKDIEEQARNMTWIPTGTYSRGDEEPYARYVEYGHPWCEGCKSFHAPSLHTANIVEGSVTVIDEEQKALPSPKIPIVISIEKAGE